MLIYSNIENIADPDQTAPQEQSDLGYTVLSSISIQKFQVNMTMEVNQIFYKL